MEKKRYGYEMWEQIIVSCKLPRGGHSHRRRSHGCDRGQEAVRRSRAVFGVVKRSRTIFKLGNSGQDINVLHVRIAHRDRLSSHSSMRLRHKTSCGSSPYPPHNRDNPLST